MPSDQSDPKPLPLSDTQARIALVVSDLRPEQQQRVMEAVATAYSAGWQDCEHAMAQASASLRTALIH